MRKFALLAALLTSLMVFAIDRSDVKVTLERLDRTIANQEVYIERRQAFIDSLVAQSKVLGTADIMMRIGEAYKGFNNDSSITYYRRGRELASGARKNVFEWEMAALMPLSGFFDEAVSTFNNINTDSIAPDQFPSYYDAGRQMHSYISAFFKDYPTVAEAHQRKAIEYQRKLLACLDKGSPDYNFNLGELYYLTKESAKALVILEEFLDNVPIENNAYAKAAHHLSTLAKENGEEELSIHYLALSAISDLSSATREVASLQELGASLYESGDVAKAYDYLSLALEKAVSCGAPLRMVETSKVLPLIEQSHTDHLNENRQRLYWVMAGLVVLMIVILIFMMILRHEMTRMAQLQAHLKTANTAKEVYISQFLELCSIYMDKLNQFCKVVTRKLAAGQSEELYRMAKSGKFIEEQSHEFYDVFDNAFLHIYPNFINEVNSLLRPDSQIELKEGETMNTDLRILAFIRLGIDDSQRIAQILNYSLNTIYSYRNRLRSRAVKRETFEEDIRQIDGAV